LEKSKGTEAFRLSVAKNFPQAERYGLTSQIKRSSRSITNNIAEGFGRFHFQENIQFCRQARGSLTETLDHMIIAYDEQIVSESVLAEFRTLYGSCMKLLNGYIAYLVKAKQPTTQNK
jgi:four helix bundle protein